MVAEDSVGSGSPEDAGISSSHTKPVGRVAGSGANIELTNGCTTGAVPRVRWTSRVMKSAIS